MHADPGVFQRWQQRQRELHDVEMRIAAAQREGRLKTAQRLQSEAEPLREEVERLLPEAMRELEEQVRALGDRRRRLHDE